MPNKAISFKYPQFASSGRIRAVPLQQIIDGSNIYVPDRDVAVGTFDASGYTSLSIPVPTGNYEISIRFIVETGTGPAYLEVDRFDRGISNNSASDGAQLQDAFFSPDLADRSIDSIVAVLTANPRFLAAVPGFIEKTWTASTVFSQGEYTWRGDGLYRCVGTTSHTNRDPLTYGNTLPVSGAVWEKKITIPTVSGTSTSEKTYDWTPFSVLATEPASRKNLAELDAKLVTILKAPDLSSYVKINVANSWVQKQYFGGGATSVTPPSNSNSTDIATTSFVKTEIANASGSSVSNSLPQPFFFARVYSPVVLPPNVAVTINPTKTIFGSHTNGKIRLPGSGWYFVSTQMRFAMDSTYDPVTLDINLVANPGLMVGQMMMFINGYQWGHLFQVHAHEFRRSLYWSQAGTRIFFAANPGDIIEFKFLFNSILSYGTLNAWIIGDELENHIAIWKMSGSTASGGQG